MALSIEVAVRQPAQAERDQRAFSRHYEETFERLVAFCRRKTSGEVDAEAIAQEAFVRAWRAWDQFQPHRPFWPWIKTIAHRICIDEARKRDRDSARRHLEATPAVDACDAAAEVEKAVEYESAAAALRRLRPDHQRILNLADIDGWSYAEIADFEGVTVHSVRASLRRARASLRKTYGRLLDGFPAALGIGWWRSLRRRAFDTAARVQSLGTSGGVGIERAGDTFAGAVAALAVVAIAAPSSVVGGTGPDTAASPPPLVVPDTDSLSETSDATPVIGPGGGNVSVAPDEDRRAQPTRDGADGGAASPSYPMAPIAIPGTPEPGAAPDPEPSPPPDGGEEPEDASFYGFATPAGPSATSTSSSAEAGDTVVASGAVDDGCEFPPCQALFRSDDGGATWHRLPAIGFTGGQVMLPPAFPDDGRIFVASPSALSVSSDGGETFVEVAPVGGPAFMSPAFSSGDPRIFLGQSGGWVYDDAIGKANPLALTPPPGGTSHTFAATDAFPDDDRLFVGGTAPSPQAPNASAVTTCRGTVCDAPVVLPGVIGTPAVLADDHEGVTTVYAWRDHKLFRSDDGGASFHRIELPETANITDIEAAEAGYLLATLSTRLADGSASGGLFQSLDRGDTWSMLGSDTALVQGVGSATVLRSGAILAAPVAGAGGGVLCSDDDGRTWRSRCGRP